MLSLAHRVGCGLTLGFCCGGLSHVTPAMLAAQYLMLGALPNDSLVRPRLQQPVVSQHFTRTRNRRTASPGAHGPVSTPPA